MNPTVFEHALSELVQFSQHWDPIRPDTAMCLAFQLSLQITQVSIDLPDLVNDFWLSSLFNGALCLPEPQSAFGLPGNRLPVQLITCLGTPEADLKMTLGRLTGRISAIFTIESGWLVDAPFFPRCIFHLDRIWKMHLGLILMNFHKILTKFDKI